MRVRIRGRRDPSPSMPAPSGIDWPVPAAPFEISLPPPADELDQNEEWVNVIHKGGSRQIRLHDYEQLYSIPGLYDAVVYDLLQCKSPQRVVRALADVHRDHSGDPSRLRVLDLGAGNGIVGELLRRQGVAGVLGTDILPGAAAAARRDRPEVYDDYVVADLTAPGQDAARRFLAFAPDALVTVAALGYGDIPPEAFAYAFNLLPDGGWLALCIKDRFLEEDERTGFGDLIGQMIADGTVDLALQQRYVHRRSTAGEKLFYVALVGQKRRSVQLH